jgi:hypothetical protein
LASSHGEKPVFIVYGHDKAAREGLELVLHKMKLEPILLENLPADGDTIIEKLERYVGQHGDGFTPDSQARTLERAAFPISLVLRPTFEIRENQTPSRFGRGYKPKISNDEIVPVAKAWQANELCSIVRKLTGHNRVLASSRGGLLMTELVLDAAINRRLVEQAAYFLNAYHEAEKHKRGGYESTSWRGQLVGFRRALDIIAGPQLASEIFECPRGNTQSLG